MKTTDFVRVSSDLKLLIDPFSASRYMWRRFWKLTGKGILMSFVRVLLILALVVSLPAEARRGRNYNDRGNREAPAGAPVGAVPGLECKGRGSEVLPINNDQVLQWKESTPNQFKARAHVMGKIVNTILDRDSHLHIEIDLNDGPQKARNENLEVVYNKKFGEVPAYRAGMILQACGDYITATQSSGPYKPSPVGAIIHWVHMSPDPSRHASGFLAIDGKVTGQKNPNDRGPSNEMPQLWERMASGF